MRASHQLIVTLGVAAAALLGCQSFQAARHYDRGSAALEHGDVQQAISELEQARRLEPGRSEIENHLGLAYTAAGRPDAALAAFDRAVELDCTNDAAQQNLAAARAGQGGADGAGPLVEEADEGASDGR
jgi:lipoprotein NlpI